MAMVCWLVCSMRVRSEVAQAGDRLVLMEFPCETISSRLIQDEIIERIRCPPWTQSM